MSAPVGQRITAYLAGGGLFNPELANHDAVRDLLIDCRAALERAEREREELRADAERYRWLRRQWVEVYSMGGHRQPYRVMLNGREHKLDARIDVLRGGGDA